jgi:hypothetical protein
MGSLVLQFTHLGDADGPYVPPICGCSRPAADSPRDGATQSLNGDTSIDGVGGRGRNSTRRRACVIVADGIQDGRN